MSLPIARLVTLFLSCVKPKCELESVPLQNKFARPWENFGFWARALCFAGIMTHFLRNLFSYYVDYRRRSLTDCVDISLFYCAKFWKAFTSSSLTNWIFASSHFISSPSSQSFCNWGSSSPSVPEVISFEGKIFGSCDAQSLIVFREKWRNPEILTALEKHPIHKSLKTTL